MAAAADQTKLRKRLEVLLKQPDNQVCSDCNKRGRTRREIYLRKRFTSQLTMHFVHSLQAQDGHLLTWAYFSASNALVSTETWEFTLVL